MFEKPNIISYLRLGSIIFFCLFCIVIGWKIVINSIFYTSSGFFFEYLGWYRGEIAYNRLLTNRGVGDNSLLKESLLIGREQDRAELIADALYVQSGSKEEIVLWYSRSLALEANPRVEKKLSLLQDSNPNDTPDTTPSPSLSGTGESVEESEESREQIREARDRIKKDENTQSQYIRKSNEKYIISDTQDFLDTGIERVDW